MFLTAVGELVSSGAGRRAMKSRVAAERRLGVLVPREAEVSLEEMPVGLQMPGGWAGRGC